MKFALQQKVAKRNVVGAGAHERSRRGGARNESMLAGSPHVAAQRMQLGEAFGAAIEGGSSVAQRKDSSLAQDTRLIANATGQGIGVAQLLRVSDDHVRADLRHPKGKKLFTSETVEDINGRVGGNFDLVSNVVLDAAVNASRLAAMMDYLHLSTRTVTSEKQLSEFLDEKEDDEHMYVLQSEKLHVAIRADNKKLPHPTLVGGDPEVDCAGTIRKNVDGSVVVTASSGHFRPTSERPGQKFVDKVMGKTAPQKHKKQVKGSKR